jgi:hypothetical protein
VVTEGQVPHDSLAERVVAFESPEIAYVVLIGKHDRDRPPLDVYQQLYELAGRGICTCWVLQSDFR